MMSGTVSQSGSDLYAVVDLSKKKKIKSSGVNDSQSSEPAVSMYAVLERESPLVSQKKEHNSQKSNPSGKQNIDFESTSGNLSVSHLKRYIFIVSAIATSVVLVAIIIMIIAIFVKLAALEAANCSFIPKNLSSPQTSENLQEFFQNQLQTIQQNIESEVISGVLENFITSCSAILQNKMDPVSGNYIVKTPIGWLRSVYCDMTRTCGGITGGWMRVAALDLNQCPPGLKAKRFGSVTTCVVTKSKGGCTSIYYPVFNMQYSKVCGQIRGYQVGSLDGFKGSSRSKDIGGNYLDGISVTSNRQHIWSFAAGRCTCTEGRKPSFINNDWTCDKGTSCTGTFCMPLLWSSQRCGTPDFSWFFKTVPNTTTTDIEVRVCRDQQRSDEDLAIKTLELYIQ